MGQKSVKRGVTISSAPPPEVTFVVGPEFVSTLKSFQKAGQGPRILKALERFQGMKSENPASTYGATDRPFQGPEYTGLAHAHLTHDISLIYRYVGALNQFKLYGFYSHDDLGTGTPPNTRKKSAVGGRLRSQVFENQ